MKRSLTAIFLCLLMALSACTTTSEGERVYKIYERAYIKATTPHDVASSYYRGEAAYNRDDYATALRQWRPLAEQGFAPAQLEIGYMYYWGRGVPKDYAETLKWHRKAATQGYAPAQVALGIMYRYGRGVGKDAAEAARWYRKGAEQGYALAQYNLGTLYFGDRHGNSRGVPQDFVQAYKWTKLALDRGYRAAERNLGIARRKLTRNQFSEANRLVREWSANHRENYRPPESTVQDIVGHARSTLTGSTYSGKSTLEMKTEALGKLSYPKPQ